MHLGVLCRSAAATAFARAAAASRAAAFTASATSAAASSRAAAVASDAAASTFSDAARASASRDRRLALRRRPLERRVHRLLPLDRRAAHRLAHRALDLLRLLEVGQQRRVGVEVLLLGGRRCRCRLARRRLAKERRVQLELRRRQVGAVVLGATARRRGGW